MSGWIQDITERKEAELNLQTALCEIKELKKPLETERAYLREEIKLEYNHENIIGQSGEINSSGPKLHLVDDLKPQASNLSPTGKTLAEVERDHISLVLAQTRGR
ncbi:MAG: hypothetical protein K9K64_09695 [Desulfohalobiaceae bacterium]|nr:hypothetical protein [Desulfohalobiaceae bacterium]